MPHRFTWLLIACLPVPSAPAAGHWVRLAAAGFPDGLAFSSVQESRTVFFPLPRDTRLTGASVVLDLQWSPLLRQPSNLRITVEDSATRVVPLQFGASEPLRVEIPVAQRLLGRRFVRVQFAVTAIASNDACLDEKLRPGFVEVLNSSGMLLHADGPSLSISGFLDMLPPEVAIALPDGAVSAGVWHATLQMAAFLQDSGRVVQVVRTRELAQIEVTPEGGGLRTTSQGSVLQVSAPWLAAGGLWPDWPSSPGAAPKLKGEPLVMRLESLQVAGGLEREVSSRAEWVLRPAARALPAGYRVTRATVRMTQAPDPANHPILLYIYANSHLIHTMRLADSGQPQEIRIVVPAEALEGSGTDEIRIVSQRRMVAGECVAGAQSYPAQLLPGTELSATPVKDVSRSLSEAPAMFRAAARLYVDARMAADVESVPALASIARRLGLDVARAEVLFASGGGGIGVDRPFLYVGGGAPSEMKSPVQFDRGEVVLTDALGRTVFHSATQPGVAVVQMATLGGATGVWIRPPGRLTQPTVLDLGHGDVAFLDGTGLLRSFDSRQVEVAQVRYPGLAMWTDWFVRYQLWLLGVAWLMLSAIFVGLYRKMMQHKEPL
ncbi:MAG: cellulose biosynthesis cyclic di-GMP-binding regulatory protein BcsB [Bryobacteraceae bacterium]|nr:cellulose biosynthesis cyclic di-GMP-binding regulatory protein BcsB [Bryobacteraceae bacterium]